MESSGTNLPCGFRVEDQNDDYNASCGTLVNPESSTFSELTISIEIKYSSL